MTIVDQKLDVVVDRLAQEYLWKKLSPDYYVISTIKEVIEKQDNTTANNSRKSYPSNRRSGYSNNAQNQENMELIDITYKDSLLTFSAENQPIKDIVAQMSDLVGVDYFLFSEPQNNITLNINKQSYDDVLSFLLNTTDYTFKKDNGVYIIGERKQERLRTTKMVKLQYRTTDKVIDVIPTEIRKNVEVKEFPELNSIILSGAELQIQEIEKFLKAIDKTVPVVLIEVMIVDVKTSYSITTGLKVGNDPNQSSSGTFNNNDQSPDGVNVTLDENSLNSIVQSILSLGWVNLGNVGNGFYFQMKALEENGKLKMNSTPKLATLNGHEASMSIGETRYFAQDQTNIIGTQNPQTVVTRTFTPVNADLSLNIKPMVSGDNQVTLEITVSQSTFTKQEGQAPPEFETREFQSLIRLKNQEMVVLGGLDRNRKSDSGTGVPVLSRIPVIKWFFSNKTKEKDHSVLTIFIRPTIIY
jgi:type IV pilus assembly protein PilQ